MNHFATRRRRSLGGMSAKGVALPLAFVVALLQVAIIVLLVLGSLQNAKVSATLNDYSAYRDEASLMVQGASILYGQSLTFVQTPDNIGPLVDAGINGPGYAEMYDLSDFNPDVISDRFSTYGVGKKSSDLLEAAKNAANDMRGIQLKAIALALSTSPGKDSLALEGLMAHLPPLSQDDMEKSDTERRQTAKNYLTDPFYSAKMQTVSQNVSNCLTSLQTESDEKIGQTMSTVRGIRIALLVTTVVFSALLLSSFLVIYLWLVSPLDRFVRGIAADRPLDAGKGLYEVRRLANSYNALLRRRESLETVLRFAAETDQLTNLPNRYRFEQYFYDSGKSGYSCAFLVFDVNHLKEINDKKGHLAGDELIRSAAECIGECFGVPGESNCFRIGGDEFAAIVKRVSQEEIDRRLAWFAKRQKEMEISVAVGLAFAEEIGTSNFRDMFLTADRNMYSDKMREHSERRKNQDA